MLLCELILIHPLSEVGS